GGRHVLALPSEGVTTPIDEVEVAVFVLPHQVARPKPGISALEDVAQPLPFGVPRARVALESAAHVRRVLEERANRFSDFVRRTGHAEAGIRAERFAGFEVELYQSRREPVREERWNTPDCSRFSLDVDQGHVAFGRGVELQNLRNLKAALEGVPHLGPQPVSATQSDVVLELGGLRLGMQEVPAELTDVLEQRALPANDVAPELARRELLADHHGAATGKDRACGEDAADAVVHRQAVVHSVARLLVHQTSEPIAPLHHPSVADVGGLWQPRRAGGVDKKRTIVDARLPALGLVQPSAVVL